MFVPDSEIFSNFKFLDHHISTMIWNYVYLNPGLTIIYNNEKFFSENGLKDLLSSKLETSLTYPIIHLLGDDIEIALSHSKSKYGETYFSFVNGQHTTQGGTHQAAFREAIAKTFKEFFNKNFESDIRQSIVAAVSIKVMEPVLSRRLKQN